MKLKSHNRELQKLRRRTRPKHQKQMKVKKYQLLWVFNQAVSHAVDVERSLLQIQFRTQFQTELSNYKAHSNQGMRIFTPNQKLRTMQVQLTKSLCRKKIEKRD